MVCSCCRRALSAMAVSSLQDQKHERSAYGELHKNAILQASDENGKTRPGPEMKKLN